MEAHHSEVSFLPFTCASESPSHSEVPEVSFQDALCSPCVVLLFFPTFHFQCLGLLSHTSPVAHWPTAILWSCLALASSNHRLRIPALRSEDSVLGYVSSNCVSFCFLEFVSWVPHFSTSISFTGMTNSAVLFSSRPDLRKVQ